MKFLTFLDGELEVGPYWGLPVAIALVVCVAYTVVSALQWAWCLLGCTITV